MKSSRKKVFRICFAILLVLTLTLYCIVCYCDYQEAINSKDNYFWAYIFMLEVAIAIAFTVEEFVLYKCISYFWAVEVKTPGKTCFYIVLLIVDLAVIVHESIIFLPLFYQSLFG